MKKAEEAPREESPELVALIGKYFAVYPAAEQIRSALIADNTMDSREIANAIRKFMDSKIGV